MPVFVCLFHIKEQLTRPLSYTSKGKHSLYCADSSLSPSFILLPPFLSEPGEAHTHSHTHPGTSLEVSGPHTQSSDFSLSSSFLSFLLTFSLIPTVFRWSLSLYHFHFFINLSPFLCTSSPPSPA